MRTADLESDSFVGNAFVGASNALSFRQYLLPHLIKVIEAFACNRCEVL